MDYDFQQDDQVGQDLRIAKMLDYIKCLEDFIQQIRLGFIAESDRPDFDRHYCVHCLKPKL